MYKIYRRGGGRKGQKSFFRKLPNFYKLFILFQRMEGLFIERSHIFNISNGNRLFILVLRNELGINVNILIPCSKNTLYDAFEPKHLNLGLKITELKQITLFKNDKVPVPLFQLCKKSRILWMQNLNLSDFPANSDERLVSYKGSSIYLFM